MRRVLLYVLAAGAVALAVAGLLGASPFGRPPTVRELAERHLAGRMPAEVGVVGGTAGPWFTDVAPLVGVRFVHDAADRGNFYLPEEMGPGVGLLDFDRDGNLDVFVAGGGTFDGQGPSQTCRLFRNDGERFTDVTERTGAGVPGHAFGVAVADYDDDGDEDVFVTRLGPNALLRNEGDGTFREVAREAGVEGGHFSTSAAWFDYDGDGRLDLYVANYVEWSVEAAKPCYTILGERDYCNPVNYPPTTDRLFRNLGGGRFADATGPSGVGAERGNGLGVLATDFDGDGRVDVYVANDQTPAFHWHNEGDGTFTNRALLSGSAYNVHGVAIAGMGVAAEDLDADGLFDLVVTNIHDQTHLVLRNAGGTFEDVSLATGVGRWSMAATSFGVALFDQDLDGELDGFFANGEVNRDNKFPAPGATNPYAQPDQFVRLRDGKFVDASAESGAAYGDMGRGVAAGDVDRDGDVDLLVANNRGPLRLLRNENRSGAAWLIVDARTGPGPRAAIGARVAVTAGDRTWRREIRAHQSYLSSSDPRAHFGLGGAAVADRVEILWPDGARSVELEVPLNRVLTVVQPRGAR